MRVYKVPVAEWGKNTIPIKKLINLIWIIIYIFIRDFNVTIVFHKTYFIIFLIINFYFILKYSLFIGDGQVFWEHTFWPVCTCIITVMYMLLKHMCIINYWLKVKPFRINIIIIAFSIVVELKYSIAF